MSNYLDETEINVLIVQKKKCFFTIKVYVETKLGDIKFQ